MEPSTVGDDLNEVSVIVNVAHRLLLGLRDDAEAEPSLQTILDDLNAAHDQIDAALESIGRALDEVDKVDQGDQEPDRPRGQRPVIH